MSKRITKKLAKELTARLLTPKEQELARIRELLIKAIKKAAHDSLPDTIKEAYTAYSVYFHTGTRYIFKNLNYKHNFSLDSIPRKSNEYDRTLPYFSYRETIRLTNDYERLVAEIADKTIVLENMLYSLKTIKKLETDFPEAYNLLEDHEKFTSSNLPALPLKEMKNWLISKNYI